MAYRLSQTSVSQALKHLCRYGDTDVFPHLPELAFLRDRHDAVVSEISQIDLESYTPNGAIEALSPKGIFSFRVVHQLPAVENIIFLSCVIEVGEDIQSHRDRLPQACSFSYKYQSSEVGNIFKDEYTYRDWCETQKEIIDALDDVTHVLEADVADFYARINFHRLDNLIDDVASTSGASSYIKRQIKIIRAKQSFGLPVGGSAARLLAELALTDTDEALKNQGIKATRYVDDFRIFLSSEKEAHEACAYLAGMLAINEGLSLNAAKTRLYAREDYENRLEAILRDVADEATGDAIGELTGSIYFDDEPNEEQIEELRNINLIGYLEGELEADHPDIGKVRTIFRALRLVLPPEAVDYICQNFSKLTLFGKELCLLMQGLAEESPGCFDAISGEVVSIALNPPASSVGLTRAWLLELFVRGIIAPNYKDINRIDSLQTTLDRRQIYLIRGRLRDVNFFRLRKTSIHQYPPFERVSLVWGASCLPKDEYEVWLNNSKSLFTEPLGHQFLEWVKKNRADLYNRLIWVPDDHPE